MKRIIKEEPIFKPSKYPFFVAFLPNLKPIMLKIIIIDVKEIILLPLEYVI